jgi:hypothetical protein
MPGPGRTLVEGHQSRRDIMSKPIRRRRRACRAVARTLVFAAALAALAATLGAGQALAVPDEHSLERQGVIDRQTAGGQADEQAARSRHTGAQVPRRFIRPEPPVDTSPRLDSDQPAPAPAPTATDGGQVGLAIALAVAALLLALGAAATWRIHHRRPRPEPTT